MLGQSKSKPLHRVAVKRQKDTAAKLLFKLWLGVLFVSCALTVGLLWLQTQDAEEVVLKTGLTPNRLLLVGGMAVLVLSCGATTMFLNCSARIRNNGLGSFLSFFLVPIVMIAWSRTPYFYAFMGPFLICLIIAYLLFRYRVRQTNKVDQKAVIESVD